ncbi:MAG: hypothetical protein GY906_28175, partial [bacterium]|nr:hypothetical protein [bacterium]
LGYRISRRLRLRVEHKIGEAKECHGLRRARFRGLEKVDAQIKITAAVMNLKLLASAFRRRGHVLAGAVSIASARNVLRSIFELVSPLIHAVGRLSLAQRSCFQVAHISQGF